MARFNRVLDIAPVAKPVVAAPTPAPVAPPVVTAPRATAGKYANCEPTPRKALVQNEPVENARIVRAAPAPKPTPASRTAAPVGYSMDEMNAKTAGSGKFVIHCNGQRMAGGKLVACGCKGLPESMVAPSIEDMRRLHHGDPRPEHVLAEVRCRRSAAFDKRGFRYRDFVGVIERADDAGKAYDASLLEGDLGRLMAKLQAMPKPGAKMGVYRSDDVRKSG